MARYSASHIREALVGKPIANVMYMSDDDRDANGWFSSPIIIKFDDGHFIIPMRDDEGNDGGALWCSVEGLETIPVM